MSENLDPIEIKFLINSPEVLEDAARVEQSLQGIDSAIAKTEKRFESYVDEQVKLNKTFLETSNLTQENKKTLLSYIDVLETLKESFSQGLDSSSAQEYAVQIEQILSLINELKENSNLNLLNFDSIDKHTQTLENAFQTLEGITEKVFQIADSEELESIQELLSNTNSEIEQTGILIAFLTEKMQAMDTDSSLFKELESDINAVMESMKSVPSIIDTTGLSIENLEELLESFKNEMSGSTDLDVIEVLNQNIEELETKITQLKNVGRSGFDEFGNKIVEQTEKTIGLKGQLTELVQQMALLKMAGKDNTEAYRELSVQATALRGAISTVNQEITQTASSTNNLDTLIRGTKGVASGYAIIKSASSLFGSDQKNVEQAILKVTSAMSLLQSLQVIQSELLQRESMATKGLILLKKLYAKAVGESTGAMKTFKVALLATGIGVFIVLLGELISNWDKVKRSIGLTSDALERSQAISKKANDLFGAQIAKLRMLAATNKEVVLTDEQKKEAVKDFNKEFSETLGAVKDYADLEERIIKNAPAYIEYLQVKAQAEASYILSLEKQKNLLEQITALSTGDLKWYDQLQDFSDKMFEKGWKAVGTDIGETNRDITQSEILNIIGLPSENQFNEALKGYSSVIQSNLKEFRKQQQKDEGLFTTSFDLQKKAGELASKLNIKTPDKEEDKAAKKAFQERIKALAEIAKAENAYQKQRLTGVEKELLDVEQRYKALREQAIKAKLDAKAIGRIDKLEVDEKKSVTYKNDTTELLKQLDKEKELYKAFEELKTQIGSTELLKRYENEFKGFTDFQSRLKSEINKIESSSVGGNIAFPEEEARLKLLKEMLAKQDIEVNQNNDKKYLEAYQALLTFEEKKGIIEAQYLQDKVQLEKITDITLRNNKLAELEYLKGLGINQLKDEAYQRRTTFENLSEDLIGITKKELSVRIASLEEYYKLSESILTNEQKVFVENEIAKAKAVIAYTDAGIREKSALQAKARIEKDLLKSRELSNEAVDELLRLLEKANSELFFMAEDSTVGILDNISLVGDSVAGLGSDLKGVNSELGEAVEQAAELASAFANILSKIASGDYIGAIVSAIATVGKMISEIGRRSEKEKQRQARQAKQAYANQLEYNAQLREQLLIETSINDLYQSRTEQIEEQLKAMKQNATSVARDIQNAFEKIFNAIKKSDKIEDTILPNGMKLNRMAYIGEILGFDMKDLKEVPQLTDEIYEKLQLLNNVDPFEGGVKETFEQLKRLKEEYGSINDAMKALAIEWKDTVTGTTASTLANSIREGVASGKKTFADFADDIEGFLRDAIVAGMSARIIEPQVQELQDALYDMMGDGALSGDEMKQFQEMYMKIVSEAKEAMDMINQAGIDIGGSDKSNTLKGAIKGITAEQADLLSGQFGGMRMAQLETNHLLRSGAASQLQSSSRMIELQTQIEINTRSTANNTLATVEELKKLNNNNGANQSNGLLLQRASGAWIP